LKDLLDKVIIGNVTVGLWLGILAPAIAWFSLLAISRSKSDSRFRESERNVAAWITKRYLVLMLIVTMGSFIARTDTQAFDSLCNTLLQNITEVLGIIIWMFAFVLLLVFVVLYPPYKRSKQKHVEGGQVVDKE